MHEEDHGLGWKHTDWRTSIPYSTRSRRLALSFVCTIANYEYGFFFYFYLDGTIETEVKLTGILSTGHTHSLTHLLTHSLTHSLTQVVSVTTNTKLEAVNTVLTWVVTYTHRYTSICSYVKWISL